MKNIIFIYTALLVFLPSHHTWAQIGKSDDKCHLVVDAKVGSDVEIGFTGVGKNYGTSKNLGLGDEVVILKKTYGEMPGCSTELDSDPDPCADRKITIDTFMTQEMIFSKEILDKKELQLVLRAKNKTKAEIALFCSHNDVDTSTKASVNLAANKNKKVSLKIP